MKRIIAQLLLAMLITGCGSETTKILQEQTTTVSQEYSEQTQTIITEETIQEQTSSEHTENEQTIDEQRKAETTQAIIENIDNKELSEYVIAIDPGHQSVGNSAQEPIGPGAYETKAKVSSGTYGPASGLNEYELNLMISLKLRDMLMEKGYTVIMTRETNDVDISNSERAAVANNANADAFVRIHANGSDDPSVNGALTICQTSNNPYNADLYSQSYALAETVLNNLTAETGAYKERVWETDTMSGINWATVPCTIVEVGYMTNTQEDLALATDEYQNKVARGIMNGIEEFLGTK